jgi:hypothetical protein
VSREGLAEFYRQLGSSLSMIEVSCSEAIRLNLRNLHCAGIDKGDKPRKKRA